MSIGEPGSSAPMNLLGPYFLVNTFNKNFWIFSSLIFKISAQLEFFFFLVNDKLLFFFNADQYCNILSHDKFTVGFPFFCVVPEIFPGNFSRA